MMIRFEEIDDTTRNLEDIKRLYITAFPIEERAPFYILMLSGKREEIEFLSIYDDDIWLGFVYTLVGEELSYIFYFAIDNVRRQSGYGSRVLQSYTLRHPRLALVIEPPVSDAENSEERFSRFNFYTKNGFEDLNARVVEMGVEFELMGTAGSGIKLEEYQSLIKKFFDFYNNKKTVVSVKEMRDADCYTIKNFISGRELMSRAGEAIFYSADWNVGDRVLIVAGSGNNAGDGYVVADFLKKEGIYVSLLLIKDKFSEDGRYYFDICKENGIEYEILGENIDYNTVLEKLDGYDYILDCIYGTGFGGKVKEPVYSLINAINNSSAYVVSADINSGMNGDTGESDICVNSDLTVSIGFLKTGLVSRAAKEHIGRLVNRDIGIIME